jgi:hypothetical protein
MDALYFRVTSGRQTTENQFEDLLQVAEKDGSGRDWKHIRQALANSVYEENRPTTSRGARTIYRIHPDVATELSRQCIYVEQGKSRYSVRDSYRPSRQDKSAVYSLSAPE